MALIVTGAQRSGTSYVATVLHEAGLPATHERRRPGTSGRRAPDPRTSPPEGGIDVSWLAAWWLPYDDSHVVHLVRDPLASIASSVARQTFARRPYGRWARDRMPHLDDIDDPVERCARYWADWNLMVERHADERLRVEDATADRLAAVVERAGFDVDRDALANAVANTATTLNTDRRRKPELTWDDVPGVVAEMAARYGY